VGTRAAGEAALLLLDVVDFLAVERIDYAVTGAMAVSVHGLVRASVDADVIVSLPPSALGPLGRRFAATGFQTALRRGDSDDPIAAMLVLTATHDNRVDLLSGLRGLETEAFARAVTVPFQGAMLRAIGREDLVAMEVFAGGPQHIADARHALSGAAGVIDLPLAPRLAARYGTAATAAFEELLAQRRVATTGARGGRAPLTAAPAPDPSPPARPRTAPSTGSARRCPAVPRRSRCPRAPSRRP
jgi:hypothetical protein